MGEYYYLLSSLPYLSFYGNPILSHPEFMEQCALWLTGGDLNQLQMGRLNIETIAHENATNDLLGRWLAFENTLRNELVKFRAKDLGLPEEVYLRHDPGFDPGAVPLVHQAMRFSSPLETEIALLKARWDFVSNFEGTHHFDLDALIIYGLKLQILERMQCFDRVKGQGVFDSIYKRPLYD